MKKLTTKVLLSILCSVLFVSLISGAGLEVSSQNISINKNYGHDAFITINIKNPTTTNFYNVSFEENPYIKITKIPLISAGQDKNVTATITSNISANTSIRLVGFYEAQVGSSSEVFNIDIIYPTGPSKCSFSLIKGDKIIFKNNETFQIIMRDANTLENIHIFSGVDSFEWLFDTPRVINYKLLRNGYPFGQVCQLAVIDDNGYVNNPQYDAIFDLNLTVQYQKTVVTATFPKTIYNLSLLSEQEGYIEVVNNGQFIAKDVTLTGDWFTFSDNHFDIAPGYSRLIACTISALGFITDTEQTNKSYTKEVKIEGNFDVIKKNYNIFVEYNEVSIGEYNSSKEDFLEWLKRNYPELLEPKVVIQYVDNATREYNITTTDEKMDGLATAVFNIADTNDLRTKSQIETNDVLNQSILDMNQTVQLIFDRVDSVNTEVTKENDISITVLLAIIFVVIVVIGAYILTYLFRQSKNKNLSRWDNNGQ